MDADSIRKRLLSRSFVLFPDDMSVDRCAKAALNLLGESEQGCNSARSALEKEIDLITLEYRKTKRAKIRCQDEKIEYEKLSNKVAVHISDTVRDIEILRKELKKERLRRQRKEECEVLAKIVNEVDPREKTQKGIKKLEEELEELKKIQQDTEAKFSLRRKQFQLLMHSIYELKEEILGTERDEEKET